MNIAYVRVSAADQNESRQVEALKPHNIDKWFTEKVSGKDMNRPQLLAMLEFAREGDTIFIHDFSRLARSTEDLLGIVKMLQEKGVEMVSNKENIDSSTSTGKLMLTMIGAINEFERANLQERQKEGVALAKLQGKYKGRKPIEIDKAAFEEVYGEVVRGERTNTYAMKKLGLKRNTYYKAVEEFKTITGRWA